MAEPETPLIHDPVNPEGDTTPSVTVRGLSLSDSELTRLHANSGKVLGIPEVTITPNAWEVTGDPENARQTTEGLYRLASFVSGTINLGGHVKLAIHEPEQTDSGTYNAYIYCYAFGIGLETVEISRQYLADETNGLLTQLQSPHRL